ncbi:MAG: c-type cytochrome [Sediminibacterium sp.]|uniref:c-type cytochrome n=1 Tax=Sediminibacterium sp. TaxID=1917865 RepID=UPI002AB8EB61|nr:c-type cytochrome [Sediminibacterium sp.]MDZ4070598.1 c-type cytochrome [Sediminibacterium sp.]
MWRKIQSDWPAYLLALVVLLVIVLKLPMNHHERVLASLEDSTWHAPSLYLDPIKNNQERELITYGKELIANTSTYLGPKGTVMQISNGMNCQNCHIDAGTKPDGNNFSAVSANYPLFRDRSGEVESIYKRVSDCFERSLNGTAPDSTSREYQAIHAYIQWLGKDVAKGSHPKGSGIKKPDFLQRAADPEKGKKVYTIYCERCHGVNGEGQVNLGNTGYSYPPLWGKNSYNTGAGLYRLSNFAGFIQSNMPFNEVSAHNKLTDEEAWDIAAYVNSQPRPIMKESHDWPDISKKPIDHPFGPYADGFSEQQHKYGPFLPIVLAREKN